MTKVSYFHLLIGTFSSEITTIKILTSAQYNVYSAAGLILRLFSSSEATTIKF